jgi:probable phosphoglycerate mutase
MILYCIRHGESTFNADGRIQGHLDPPLSELGHRQAAALAAAYGKLPIEAIYCSPLLRAKQTAAPLAAALKLELFIEPDLIEIHAGIFQGKRGDEVGFEYPHEWAVWRRGDPDYAIPQGESRRTVMIRGGAMLQTIAQGPQGQVAVVSHGGLLAGALKTMLEIPAHKHPFSIENAAIARLEITPDRVRLHTMNQSDHLRGLELPNAGDL